jgi:hypothetical protein
VDIDISIGKDSLTFTVKNPYRFDVSTVMDGILDFGRKSGVELNGLKIDLLIPRMIRGVTGCENGCPSDAKSLVRDGFGDFSLSYIEGGILSAVHNLGENRVLSVRVFPDFD